MHKFIKIFIGILIIGILIFIFMPYQYTDEEVALIKESAKIESVIISEMLEDFAFKGKPMNFPLMVEDLPNELSINKIAPIAFLVDYDVEILLMYEDDTIAMCNKSPKDDSIIFEFFTDSTCKDAYLFTINGIGIGSTEQDLLKTFPNYEAPYEEVLEKGDTYRLFCYVSEKGYNEQISFRTKNGIIDAVNITNY